ncbi:hypothetical protein GBAR_LOCUS26164 [Geodia barretti]|uniref:Uncharacterized protein n=1 Tax=Geodia barretti TaxID=519541 RepID=A0AA35THU5_GEOBA|nr:hypothetical protein GBAR_LOCUS26164 [Geodia barretti]
MDEEGGTPGRVSELSELFRELQLLRLKYDQLVDVCLKLTESWSQENEMTSHPKKDLPLKVARKLQNREVRRNYQYVAVVRHKGGGTENKRKGSPVSSLAPRRLENASKMMEVASSSTKSLTTSSVNHEDAEEDEETQFQLSRDGSKLRMPSKYTALQTTILRFRDQVSSQTTTDPSTAAMKQHFVNRLLPKGSCVSHRALQLELARQEYKLLTDEAKNLLGGEADVTSAREKLEAIVNRASAVEDITESSKQQNATMDKTNQETSRDTSRLQTRNSTSWEERSASRTPDNGPLVYSTLTELLQLVEAENRLRMARIETQLLKFCTEVVLPKYQLTQHQELSTTSVQILSELAGRPKPIFIRDD